MQGWPECPDTRHRRELPEGAINGREEAIANVATASVQVGGALINFEGGVVADDDPSLHVATGSP